MSNQGNIPPQALDSERFALASLLISPELIQMTSLGVDDFYSTANKRIFSVLTHLSKSGIPVDIVSMSENLSKVNQGENIDTLAILDDLYSNSASSTDISYHVKTLREKAKLRKILTSSYELQSQIIADAHIEKITEKLETLKKSILSTPDFSEKVYVPTWDNCPEDSEALIELSNVRILSRGNMAMLTACAGAGKSSILEAACSAMLLPIGDTLGLTLSVKSLLYIDSERSRFDHNQSWQRALKRAGIGPGASIPAEWQWENIKPIENLSDRLQYLWSRLDASKVPEIVLLDGIGDFVADPNDSDECTSLVYRLGAVADLRNIGILLTLHNNPAMNSDKARGVLGSELWRKCESVMIINKLDDGIRQLTTDYALGKNRSGSDKVASFFQWDNEKKMHVSCPAPSGPKGKTSCEHEKILELIGTQQSWAYTELRAGIMACTKKSSRTAEQRIKDLTVLRKIAKSDDGTYQICDKKHLEIPDYIHD